MPAVFDFSTYNEPNPSRNGLQYVFQPLEKPETGYEKIESQTIHPKELRGSLRHIYVVTYNI